MVEGLQDLIALAKDVRNARNWGEEASLTAGEVAPFDALADKQGAVQVPGNDHLKIIAHDRLTGRKANASIDRARRNSARPRLRVVAQRILRKLGYPPDLEDAAIRSVPAQAKALPSTGASKHSFCPASREGLARGRKGRAADVCRDLCPMRSRVRNAQGPPGVHASPARTPQPLPGSDAYAEDPADACSDRHGGGTPE